MNTMKLAVCIVHQRDKGTLADELVRAGFKFTVLASSGGFLREGNGTFLIGLEEEEIPGLKKVVEENCHAREQTVNVGMFEATPAAYIGNPVSVPVGGAVMFVVDVAEFVRF